MAGMGTDGRGTATQDELGRHWGGRRPRHDLMAIATAVAAGVFVNKDL